MKQRIIYILALLFATMQASAQTYTYDSNYRLTEVKYGNGITVTYTYDALGNRLTKKVTGGVVKGDANGDKRVSITDAVGIVNYILGPAVFLKLCNNRLTGIDEIHAESRCIFPGN